MLDFMVTEAVAAKAAQIMEEQREDQERQRWMQNHKENAPRAG